MFRVSDRTPGTWSPRIAHNMAASILERVHDASPPQLHAFHIPTQAIFGGFPLSAVVGSILCLNSHLLLVSHCTATLAQELIDRDNVVFTCRDNDSIKATIAAASIESHTILHPNPYTRLRSPVQDQSFQYLKMHALTILTVLAASVVARPEKARIQSEGVVDLIPRQVLNDMTVEQAAASCGDNGTISCCNKVKQGDTISESNGILSGLLNNALADGLTLADQCSKISVSTNTHTVIGVQDLLNDQCTNTVACCQNTGGSAVSIVMPRFFDPLLTRPRLAVSSTSTFLVSPLVAFLVKVISHEEAQRPAVNPQSAFVIRSRPSENDKVHLPYPTYAFQNNTMSLHITNTHSLS
ncbi:fungal hydrophobin domain-containing protein [Sarocladium implicatum]|nr:fungal hydrophobin domain-containing protein [Sarocladium implicatum]